MRARFLMNMARHFKLVSVRLSLRTSVAVTDAPPVPKTKGTFHRTFAQNESLFFQVSKFLDEGQAEAFVEDFDKYGEVALCWYDLVISR